MIGDFLLILNTDWMINKQLHVNVNHSYLQTVANNVTLKFGSQDIRQAVYTDFADSMQ